MSSLEIRIVRTIVGAAAALGFLIAPTALTGQPASQSEARPCYNGIVPGNPWATSCNFGPRPPKGLPDQTAVIACRDIPGCLSWYINGP